MVKSPPLRFVAPSAHHDSGAGCRSGSTPNTFPPRSFADPRGFKPHPSLRSCFIPLTLMGFRSFKVFPCCRALPNSSLGAPLSVFRPLAAIRIRRFKRRVRDAPPGVYARQKSVPPDPHIAARLGSIPSWTFNGLATCPLRLHSFNATVGLSRLACPGVETPDSHAFRSSAAPIAASWFPFEVLSTLSG